MESYKFRTASSGILYHSSWITSSSRCRDVGGGNLFLTLVSRLTRVVQWCSNLVIVFAREDAEVRLHAFQTLTKQFCVNGGTVVLENCIVARNLRLYYGMHLVSQPVHILSCSNSAMKGNNGTNRIPYHDISAQTITEFPCGSLLEPGFPDCRLLWVLSKRKLFLM
jgi:hypothetical protein